MKLRILDIPNVFNISKKINYPPHQLNSPLIEERAIKYFSRENIFSDYIYIPMEWTRYHISNNYGKNTSKLKNFFDQVSIKYPRDKFFTIVQYDGGTLVPINNCRVFACSGDWNSPKGINSQYEAIPLLSDPHKICQKSKTITASFVGTFDNHPIRKEMYNVLKKISGFKIFHTPRFFKEYFYKNNMLKSIFALCPRGYGPATFRMYEAIQLGVIPIYISDEFWLPFADEINWNNVAILVNEKNINQIPKIVNQLFDTGDYKNFLKYTSSIYDSYFTWDGLLNKIEKKICS